MEHNIQATSKMERNMVKVVINGKINLHIQVSGLKICSTEMENILGQTGEVMKELGKIMQCMEKVYIHGQMAVNIMVNLLWIRNMDMENINKQMGLNIKANG